jgi:acetyltransferase-like isoleucine patch superfamily enzyme
MSTRFAAFATALACGGQLDSHGLLGQPGYTVPSLDGASVHSFADIRAGKVPNVRLMGTEFGDDNVVVVEAGATFTQDLRLYTLPRTTGAIVVLGRDLALSGDLRLMAPDQTVVLTGGIAEIGSSGNFNAHIWGYRSLLFVGSKSTTNGNQYVLSGEGSAIIVGDDCMFAQDIHISTHDQHAVVDIETNALLNSPGDVVIEPHVWLGRRTTVGKRVSIGLGSVVGAHSLVTKGCPRFSVFGGAPAKVLRTGATWDRTAIPRRDTLARVKDLAVRVPSPLGEFRLA